jgi:hypothetical protein
MKMQRNRHFDQIRKRTGLITIRALLNRLVDLDGTLAFTIEVPAIGVTVREIRQWTIERRRSN